MLPMTLLVIVKSKDNQEDDNDMVDKVAVSEYIGHGRVFPFLPPYLGVDFAANFNKLKSSGDAAYFVVRDSIVVSSTREAACLTHCPEQGVGWLAGLIRYKS